MTAFDYVRDYYPHYMRGEDVQKFLVPIKPPFHKILFPDYEYPGQSLSGNHPHRHVGNAIKLAYLCHPPNKQPGAGDIVLFYRSHDVRAVTTLGIVESYTVSTSANDIARMVSRRTVYSSAEIEQMATYGETKVMLFRLIGHLKASVTFDTLKKLRVVKGGIQSIMKISDESLSRILDAAER